MEKKFVGAKCRPTQLQSKNDDESGGNVKKLLQNSRVSFFKRRFSAKNLHFRGASSCGTTPDGCNGAATASTALSLSNLFKIDNNENTIKAKSALTSPMSTATSSGFENGAKVACASSSVTTTAATVQIPSNSATGSLSPTIAKLLTCIPLKKFSNASAGAGGRRHHQQYRSRHCSSPESEYNYVIAPGSDSMTSSSTTCVAAAASRIDHHEQQRLSSQSINLHNNNNNNNNNAKNDIQNNGNNISSADLLDFRMSGVYLGGESDDVSQRKNHQQRKVGNSLSSPPLDYGHYSKKSESTEGGSGKSGDNIRGKKALFKFGSSTSRSHDDDDDDERRDEIFSPASSPERGNDISVKSPEEFSPSGAVSPQSPAGSLYSTPPSSVSPRPRQPPSAAAYCNGGDYDVTTCDNEKLMRRSLSLVGANGPMVKDESVAVNNNNNNVNCNGVCEKLKSSPRKSSQPSLINFGVEKDNVSTSSAADTVPPLTESSVKKTPVLKKKRSFAQPIAKKLSFLRRRPTDTSLVTGQPSTSNNSVKPNENEVKNWALSFDSLLRNKQAVVLFRLFLQREFSDENIEFWLACEEYKRIKDMEKLKEFAKQIYVDFVALQAPKEVNLDAVTRGNTIEALANPDKSTFDLAQHRIESLMAKDSYPRFLRSELYLDLLK